MIKSEVSRVCFGGGISAFRLWLFGPFGAARRTRVQVMKFDD
jgi:hypothetical protein